MGSINHIEKIHAYRHLYRELLRAVQFAAPYRYVVRNQLRATFREKDACWDKEEYKRTMWFLQAAAREAGLEHKVLKNLIRVAHERQKLEPWKLSYRRAEDSKGKKLYDEGREITSTAFNHYDMTVAMLNKTMGIRLR
ncbi:mitochondrial carrier protein [Colletotrichum tofieldiae]|uniref:Mitochondrial carrier protein n=1 Tax=Colletotrichum tofieldiae TaxID=708197 RepID=A0A166N273_9PEZI|nr:mitochondrial carrier protein [Colletotrichum tofieldiae]GKT57331.1 mitochondrial carrier protein [Colletotrichum tofieldiae]GKT79058.1 mitochondrial carrier protein [Colletotrichum tofieldiae]GKT86716.1 mitochondrial carrier protein [Colletotrichum tofieldiae]